jgi:sugar fermentation stimulation protein A
MNTNTGVRLFTNDQEALFVRRPNRFLIIAQDGKRELACHCPNPGRLIEFLFPGVRLILEKRKPEQDTAASKAKTGWTVVGTYYQDRIAPLFSSRANKAAERVILNKIIPGLREIHPEYSIASSRFDFLCVDTEGKRHLIEVKACSLVEYGVAMFPDAPSGRAVKHLEELAELAHKGYCCHILFVIVHGDPGSFIPNLHTDPQFAGGLSRYGVGVGSDAGVGVPGDKVRVHASLLRCDQAGRAILADPYIPVDLSHGDLAERDSGNYLILLEIPEQQAIEVGSLGTITFAAGWYVYTGSAQKNLSRRVNRHLRKTRKQTHWHIDYLTPYTSTIKALPIMSYGNLECDLAQSLSGLGGRPIPGFGCSDCHCGSHLFYFAKPPMGNRAFVEMLLQYRHIEGLIRRD